MAQKKLNMAQVFVKDINTNGQNQNSPCWSFTVHSFLFFFEVINFCFFFGWKFLEEWMLEGGGKTVFPVKNMYLYVTYVIFIFIYMHIYIYTYMYIYIHTYIYILYYIYVWYLICGVDTPYCNLTVTKKTIAFCSGVLSARFEFLMLEFLPQAKKNYLLRPNGLRFFLVPTLFPKQSCFIPYNDIFLVPSSHHQRVFFPRTTLSRAHCIPGRFALWMLMQMATWRVKRAVWLGILGYLDGKNLGARGISSQDSSGKWRFSSGSPILKI